MSDNKKDKIQIIDNKKYFKDAWMEKRGDLYVLHLKGSPYEVGYQHGILMKEEIKKGAVGEQIGRRYDMCISVRIIVSSTIWQIF